MRWIRFTCQAAPRGAAESYSRPFGYPWPMPQPKRLHRQRNALAAILLGVALAPAPPAAADTLKCGRHQVTLGDSKATVLQWCGEPDLKEVVSGGAGATTVRTEQWLYDRGQRRFQALLTFAGMGLIRIEFLTRQ